MRPSFLVRIFGAWLLLALWACSAASDKDPKLFVLAKNDSGLVGREKSSSPWQPKLPQVFGCDFNGHPAKFERKLEALGYSRKDFKLEAPYTRIVYVQGDSRAIFDQVDLLVCNHPARLASLKFKGRNKERVYATVRQKFGLDFAALDLDDRADFRYGRYVRDFAEGVRVTLDQKDFSQELKIEGRDLKAFCQKALHTDLEKLASQKKADDSAIRKKYDAAF